MSTATVAADRSVRRIESTRGLAAFDLREFWRYRELLVFLVWRDIKIRYKQTFLGPIWAILRPILMTVVFTFVFSRIAGISTPGPYQLFSFTGVVVWTYFASALNGGSMSVLGNASLVSKVYFPRLHVTLAAITAPLVDLVLSLLAGSVFFVYYHVTPSWHVIAVPAFALLTAALALGMGLWLAPMTVRYRDVPYVLPLLTQLWMFVTPIAYPLTRIYQQLPTGWRWVADVNPLTAPVIGFRWALTGTTPPTWTAIGSSAGLAAFLIATGFISFRRMERTLADVF
jgi:homopolymeric O-antigen transport system permease protein